MRVTPESIRAVAVYLDAKAWPAPCTLSERLRSEADQLERWQQEYRDARALLK